jgi:AraC-like DNA-binding protein
MIVIPDLCFRRVCPLVQARLATKRRPKPSPRVRYMGEAFNLVQSLESPFNFVEERVIFVPRGECLRVQSREFKIVLMLDGAAELTADGVALGPIKRGDALVVPGACTLIYTPLRPGEERLHIFRLTFAPLVLDMKRANEASQDDAEAPSAFVAFLRENFGRVRLLTGVYTRGLEEWVRLIRLETERKEPGYAQRVEAFCRLLVTDLAREMIKTDARSLPGVGSVDRSSTSANWAVRHVKQYLLEHHDKALNLEQIANDVKLSAEHLSRCFKRATGQTVFGYLREIRIEAAKALLVSSKFTVTEIAARTGFSSVMLFCRVFRQATGSTPKTFRESAVTGITFERSTTAPRSNVSRSSVSSWRRRTS